MNWASDLITDFDGDILKLLLVKLLRDFICEGYIPVAQLVDEANF